MAFSYSFHISSKGSAVTTKGKLAQVGRHNTRAYKSECRYDKDNIDILVGTNNLVDDVKRVYHEQFDDALSDYNKKVRADRQIDDYFEHVSNSRADVAVEAILQIGDKDSWSGVDVNDNGRRNLINEIFRDQLKSLQDCCPSFKIASAVVHYDESSPHMHVVGVPVAHGYQKGMECQVAKTKVFTKDSLTIIQDTMHKRAEQVVMLAPHIFGVSSEVHLKEKEKGRNKDIPKQSLDEFYSLQNGTKELKAEKETVEAEIIPLRELKTGIDTIKGQGKPNLVGSKVTLSKGDYETLTAQASAYVANRDEISRIREKQSQLDTIEKSMKQEALSLKQEKELIAKQEQKAIQMYQRQRDVNQLLEQAERTIKEKDKLLAQKDDTINRWHDKFVNVAKQKNYTIASLESDISDLQQTVEVLKDKLANSLKTAYTALRDVVMAVGMLKYDKDDGYAIEEPTRLQSRIIDGVVDFASEKMQQVGFDEMADETKKHIGISDDLEDSLEPLYHRSRGIER